LASRPQPRARDIARAVGEPLEAVHLHGMDHTSINLCLPPSRAAELCGRGWAEPHQYAD